MNSKKAVSIGFIAVLLMSFATILPTQAAGYDGGNWICVDPPYIRGGAVGSGFYVKINISATAVYGIDWKFQWNNTLLKLATDNATADIVVTPPWSSYLEGLNQYTHDVVPGIDEHYAGYSAKGTTTYTGNKTICTYHFKVKYAPGTGEPGASCLLNLVDEDTIMVPYEGEMEYDIYDGLYVISTGAPPAKLSIKPSHHLATNIGQIFTINITISNVYRLYGYEFKLYYNTTLLTALNVELPSDHFLKPADPSKISITHNQTNDNFNATHGQVWFEVTLLAPEASKSGSGTLVKVKFNTTAFGGPSPLKLVYPSYFYPVKLFDPNKNPMPCTAQDGSVTVIPPPPAKLYLDPPQIVNPSLSPCNNFTVSINILNATEIYSWEFKIFYKNTILNATHVAEGTFLNNSGPTSFQIIELNNNYNLTHGVVWLNCSLLTPPPVDGQGTLATITFHVEAIGETTLDLTDTILKNPINKTLSHYAVDGYFDNVLRAYLFVDPSSICLLYTSDAADE